MLVGVIMPGMPRTMMPGMPHSLSARPRPLFIAACSLVDTIMDHSLVAMITVRSLVNRTVAFLISVPLPGTLPAIVIRGGLVDPRRHRHPRRPCTFFMVTTASLMDFCLHLL